MNKLKNQKIEIENLKQTVDSQKDIIKKLKKIIKNILSENGILASVIIRTRNGIDNVADYKEWIEKCINLFNKKQYDKLKQYIYKASAFGSDDAHVISNFEGVNDNV